MARRAEAQQQSLGDDSSPGQHEDAREYLLPVLKNNNQSQGQRNQIWRAPIFAWLRAFSPGDGAMEAPQR